MLRSVIGSGSMPPDSTQLFGFLLREDRLAAGLTQEALAERAGLSVHGIQKLERGVTRPFRDTVERLVTALQLGDADAATLRGAAGPVRRHGTGWPATGRHNLPTPLTTFVGRERDLEELSLLVRRTRLLTLVGTGGCGKTRLAIELARSLASQYPDGVWFIELAPLTDSSLVAHQIGAVVGVRETTGEE
jgi:transcriptional regulator with XRE-family HTH domain